MAASLTGTDHNLPFSQPVCQNCQTSTTPLWRRDEAGSVLCNACGLFLKLHGRPRPISLKTDVIKSRNRVKTSNQGPKKKVSCVAKFAGASARADMLQVGPKWPSCPQWPSGRTVGSYHTPKWDQCAPARLTDGRFGSL